MIFCNQHKNIVNVDFHLTNKLHLKNYIVIDDFFIRSLNPQLLVPVNVVALVVLHITRGEQLIACKVIKRGKDVPQPQDCAKQRDKVLLVLFALNRLPQREFFLQPCNQVFIAIVVLAGLVIALIISLIVFQQNDTSSFAVSK